MALLKKKGDMHVYGINLKDHIRQFTNAIIMVFIYVIGVTILTFIGYIEAKSFLFVCIGGVLVFLLFPYFTHMNYYRLERNRKIIIDYENRLINIKTFSKEEIFGFDDITEYNVYGDNGQASYFFSPNSSYYYTVVRLFDGREFIWTSLLGTFERPIQNNAQSYDHYKMFPFIN